jgi:hypothetical protein
MVDINLIGDDDKDQHENEDFSNDYDADTGDYSSESEFSDSDLDHSLYDRSYTQSKSKKTAFIIFGILAVAAIAVVIFIVMKSSKDKPKITEEIKTESVQQAEKTETPTEQIPETPAVNIPTFVRENINSTRRGIKAVETILSTIPQNVNFTMIKYRDGSFLTEFLGRTSNNISDVNNVLQQRFPTGNVKVISRDKRNIGGRSYQQALLNGSISIDDSGILSLPNFLSPNEIKNQFAEYCKQFGLTMNKFEINQQITSKGHQVIPVIFHAVGSKDALLNLLNKIIEANLNVNVVKIVFITYDVNLNSNKIKLILNMEIYNQM